MDYFSNKKRAIGLIHKVYLAHLKTFRKYTASTKTKSEVRGGGKKPWKQKGTGQARAGSIRSPLWVGGGVIFGPKPRLVFKKINKKEKRLALLAALFLKKANYVFFDEAILDTISPRTSSTLSFLNKLNINLSKNTLCILNKPNENFRLGTRNLKNIDITLTNSLNVGQILKAETIILDQKSLEEIKILYGKE